MFLLLFISAFATFIAIAVFGFIFVLASALLGELFEHGDFGHDLDHGGPSVLSSRVLSVFVTAFGAFGALGDRLGYSLAASIGLGFGGGIIFAGVVFAFARFLYGQQASSHVEIGDLVGKTAEVFIGIPKGGLGQVRCRLGDSMVEKIARARDNEEIPANTLVKIEEIVGDTLLVRRTE